MGFLPGLPFLVHALLKVNQNGLTAWFCGSYQSIVCKGLFAI